ncbi:MAG: hypothetical protein FJ030_14965 [Chloroflexi bacterium]|nr:hypothetical protein [Chloroflexota bacterium]
MTASKPKTLLPEGAEIDHNGRPLRILKRLNSGLTGEVYRGELETEDSAKIEVAVKAMKALEFPLARKLFEGEGLTLSLLMGYEEDANKEQRTALKAAPFYYGSGEYESTPYLVMEFINGKGIPELLTKQRKFSELQAITAGWHLYRALDILHTRLKKTFIDLKFENLWWVETENDGHLKLTDFGTLEDANERGAKRDSLLAAVYLCAMLTGRTLNYSLGELKERAKPVIDQSKAEISYGAHRLLQRLLHRNPAARLTDVAAITTELRALANFWRQPVEKTLEAGRSLLIRAEGDADKKSAKAREDAARARAALDIGRLQLSANDERQADLKEDILRADKFIAASDYLESGKALFLGRGYAAARRNFEEGTHWADAPAPLRRWAYLARTGEETDSAVFDAHRDEAMQALDKLNAGDLPHAANRIVDLAPHLQSPGWGFLTTDCKLFSALKTAEEARARRDFAASANAFREAMGLLEKLPDAQFIRDEEIGDLRPALEEVENRDATEGEAKRLVAKAADAIEQGQWDEAFSLARKSFLADRANPECLTDLQTLAEAALQKSNFAAAAQIAHIGTLAPHPPQGLLNVLNLAARLRTAELALQRGDDTFFVEQLREAHNLFSGYALAPLRHLMDQAASQTTNADFLAALAAFAESLSPDNRPRAAKWRERAAAIESNRRAQREKALDELIKRTDHLLIYDRLEPAAAEGITLAEFIQRLHGREKRLEEAQRLITDAETLAAAGGYRADDIRARRQRIDSARQQTQIRHSAARTKSEERLKSIQERWAHLSKMGGSSFPGQLQPALTQLIGDCYAFLAEVDGNNQTVSATLGEASSALKRMGKSGWEKLKVESEAQLSQIEKDFRDAQTAFQRGDSARAAAEADRLAADYRGSPEWAELKTNIAQAELWRAWQRQNSDIFQSGRLDRKILGAIRSIKKLLPLAYWQADTERYLQAARDEAKAQADQHRGQPERNDFLADLRYWLDVEWASRASNLPAGKLDADDFMLNAYTAARAGVGELERVVHETSTPDDIDSALNSLTAEAWTTIVRREKQKEEEQERKQREEERKRKEQQGASRPMLLAIVGVAATLACILLGVGGFIIYQSDPDGYRQKLFGSFTPTWTPVVEVVTTTPTVTWTPSPTPIPPTPTPTPIPPSAFQVDPASLYPPIPIAGDAAWVINDQNAAVNPPLTDASVWVKANSGDAGANGEEFFHTNVGNAAIVWNMDVPLNAGLYQLNITDTKANSGGYGPQAFTVLLDGAPAVAYRGEASVMFNTTAGQQAADEWLPLGVYEVRQNQQLSVQAVTPDLSAPDLGGTAFFALDHLLIVKVSESQRPMIDALPFGRVVVNMLDDSRAVFRLGERALADKYQGQPQTDALAWGNAFRSLLWDANLTNAVGNKVLVKWSPLGRLPAGEYELLVWVPASHSTVVVDFSLLADGVEIKPETPRPLDQKSASGQWVSLGTWVLENEAAVGVRMTIAKQEGAEIGVDAVALARVGP